MWPEFLLQKIMINYHSSVECVVNQSLHYLIIDFQQQIPISISLVVFPGIRIFVKQSEMCSTHIIIIMLRECQMLFS